MLIRSGSFLMILFPSFPTQQHVHTNTLARHINEWPPLQCSNIRKQRHTKNEKPIVLHQIFVFLWSWVASTFSVWTFITNKGNFTLAWNFPIHLVGHHTGARATQLLHLDYSELALIAVLYHRNQQFMFNNSKFSFNNEQVMQTHLINYNTQKQTETNKQTLSFSTTSRDLLFRLCLSPF